MPSELTLLNAATAHERLENLKALLASEGQPPERQPQYANNHIHTFYSFSPYSPAAAVWFARKAGLPTAGIMDHDTVAGASEFREAGSLAGVGATCGFECRVSLSGTPLESRRINNPDQMGVAYMAFHSVRARHFDRVDQVFASLRKKRNERNRAMVSLASKETGIALDFDKDVLALSKYAEGGTVTERHILYALAGKIGAEDRKQNPYWQYSILGRLKTELLPKIYIPADAELLTLCAAATLAKELDAILCYAYLGDVSASVTGDKADAKYEDAYLEDLLSLMKAAGVAGVTYMPSRNTPEQLARLMSLCDRYGFMQISGEDINQPGQSFICKELADKRFWHLADAARYLVEREL
ncbi:MAG: PHP domain-containing protein [Clostridiales bacterium]|nr:PHP domain-containing protein [Clostridiales bacterium]